MSSRHGKEAVLTLTVKGESLEIPWGRGKPMVIIAISGGENSRLPSPEEEGGEGKNIHRWEKKERRR